MRLHYLGPFLGSDLFNDFSHANQNYKFFIETFLYYQRLFDYSGDIDSILEMPYCLYNDLIIEQIKMKKKEMKEMENKKHSTNFNKKR